MKRLMDNTENNSGLPSQNKGRYLFMTILAIVLLCEAVVMALLHIFSLKGPWNIIIDPLLLAAITAPLLYWFIVKPMQNIIKKLSELNHQTKQTQQQSFKHNKTVEKLDAKLEQQDDVKLSGRILVAEDSPTNQKLISLILEKTGLEVVIAEDGKQALDKALSEKFDLILMDIQMPNMNGYQATRKIRRNGIETAIIAVTAHAMAGDDQKCLDAGCNDYLTKPINSKILLSTISKYLQIPDESVT